MQELGFDYLRDNLAANIGKVVMRWPKSFHFAIVDEVDSVLIDDGRNPLLISGELVKMQHAIQLLLKWPTACTWPSLQCGTQR